MYSRIAKSFYAAFLAVAFSCLAIAVACALPRPALAAEPLTVSIASGSSDVKTVHADTLVYRGGYYDYIVEPIGFTAKSYQWWIKFGDSSATSWGYEHSIDHTVDGEEDPTWFSGFNTNHLKFCTNNFKSDSDPDDWGAFEFYCKITDTAGKTHRSDTFCMVIKGTDTFNSKYDEQEANGYGLSFASVTPARESDGTMTKIEMTLGESQVFSFTLNNGLNAWLSESDPKINTTIEVMSADKSVWEKHPGVSAWTFKPEKAGEYLVYMGANLQLGYNYDTGKGDGQYYLVSVKEPPAGSGGSSTEQPADELVSSIEGGNCFFTIEEPWIADTAPVAGATIPDVQIKVPSTYDEKVDYSIAWYRQVGVGWEACENLGETAFLAGCAYQLRAQFVAKKGYYLKSNLHGTPTMLKTNIEFEGVSSTSGKPISRMGKSYLPTHSYSSQIATYKLREYTVEETASAPSSSELSGKEGLVDISAATVNVADMAFTGSPLTPDVTVDCGGKTLVAGLDYTISYANNTNIGKASVTVTGMGDYTGQAAKSFKVNPAAVALKKLKKASKSFTVSWKRASGVTGYQVQYSLKKNFKKAKIKTVKKAKTVKLKVPNLKSKKKYYVRVRAYKKVGGVAYYSTWSKAKSVKVK